MRLTEKDYLDISAKEIKEAILNDGSKVRIFISKCKNLCQFLPNSKTKGKLLNEGNILSLVTPKPKKSEDELEYKIISKFRKEALKSSFKNNFIQDCLNLPSSFDQWVKEGKKSAYEYNVTTGCKITGDLISIESICKRLNPYHFEEIKKAIKTKTPYKTGTFNYNGYDGSISLEIKDDGTFKGFFSKEYKGTGNGYYYILINDKYFIGYDVD